MAARHVLEDLKGEHRELQGAWVNVEALMIQHPLLVGRSPYWLRRFAHAHDYEDEDEDEDEGTPLPWRPSRRVQREIVGPSHGTRRAGLTMCREAQKTRRNERRPCD
jgi:hypothetical protein